MLNNHNFWHDFDCLTPICNCDTGIEDNEHVFLHSPQLDSMRDDRFGQISEIPALDIKVMNTTAWHSLLLNGGSQLNSVPNRLIFDAMIPYIKTTQCFQ